jgi:hypothetical protein
MSREELQRRVLIGSDWQGEFLCSLDGIPEIPYIPGCRIDGCRTGKEVRSTYLCSSSLSARLHGQRRGLAR